MAAQKPPPGLVDVVGAEMAATHYLAHGRKGASRPERRLAKRLMRLVVLIKTMPQYKNGGHNGIVG